MKYNANQKDFSGGEISGRMLSRDDLEVFGKALLNMQNFMPTLQGSAVRTPGSRYVYTAPSNAVRIFPYYTPANDRALIELTPGAIRIVDSLIPILGEGVMLAGQQPGLNVATTIYRQIVDNFDFVGGYTGWDAEPIAFPSPIDGAILGWGFNRGDMQATARAWKNEDVSCTLTTSTVIPEATSKLIITPNILYVANFSSVDARYTFSMKVGTTAGAGDVWEESFNETDYQVGYAYQRNIELSGLSLAQDQELFITITLSPLKDNNEPSTPQFRVRSFGVYTLVTVDIGSDAPTGVVPYTAADLPDIQYVQSPYVEVDNDVAVGSGKEVVFTHPSYPPHWLKFDGTAGSYVFEPIPFHYVNDQGADVAWEPPQWTDSNYPAACASFNGRLMLGGSQDAPILGSPTGSATETVWGTKVGQWSTFTDPAQEEVFPDDSIEFTAIYRSPIQWLFGQKDLLIGAREMEYVASADTIFQPADIGVRMQSTHGSSAVQPVGMGQSVLFPAEGGTKVRSLTLTNEAQGWVSPDMTAFHPGLFASGIVRMVRMRNPHQMTVVVMGNGQIAILHQDSYMGVMGWSRINLNAVAKDACVVADEDGVDVLFVTVQRWIEGVLYTYVEAFRNWVDGGRYEYTQSSSLIVPVGNIISGLQHLIGRNVQVIGDGNYLGSYVVDSSGDVTLVDSTGEPIYVTAAVVGLAIQAKIVTLPIVGNDPTASKRRPKITVRGLFSSRVIINGERPADRAPATLMDTSQQVDIFRDYKVANLGWDDAPTITIEENAPVRSELIGVFGTVQANDL